MDNYLSNSTDNNVLSDKGQKEITAIELFSECFHQRYGQCPAFFIGTLQDACEQAFSPTKTVERRPVLLYIHDDNSFHSNIFCKTMFCSTLVIDYLLDNYIVWPWDITSESNKYALRKIWEELFPNESFDDFCVHKCPLLIGIMRTFEDKIIDLKTLKYQLKPLIESDFIKRTELRVNREMLLEELHIFKRECDEHEKNLSFDFVKTTGLCWEIIFKIAKYLSLNDAISTFSPAIISLLKNPELKFQLSDPSIPFIKLIQQEFQLKQIVSLQIDGNQSKSLTNLESLSIFKNIKSITILDCTYKGQIIPYQIYLRQITYFSLFYNNEIDLNTIYDLLIEDWTPIQRLVVRTTGLLCSHYNDRIPSRERDAKMRGANYFLLDIRHFSWISMDKCLIHHQSCFLTNVTEFIRKLPRIRCFHLIINKQDIERLIDVDIWTQLVTKCWNLEKITLRLWKNVSQKEQLVQKASTIQTALCQIRRSMSFQIKFL